MNARLGAHVALSCAVAALVLSAAASILFVWATPLLSASGLIWIVPTLTTGLCPLLIAVGGVAIARQHGRLSRPRAIAVLTLALAALALATLGRLSFAQAFSAANDDRPSSAFGASWPWLAISAALLGTVAIALLVAALVRPARHRIINAALASAVAIVAVPVLGATLGSPFTSVFGAAGLTALALGAPPRTLHGQPASPVSSAGSGIPPKTRRVTRLLALSTAVISTGGVVHALAGVHWSTPANGTEVMRQGISISLVAAMPLLVAVGLLVNARGRTRPIHNWGQLLLVAVALAAVAVGYRAIPSGGDMAPSLVTGSVLVGAAFAWWLVPRLPGSPQARVSVAVAIGVAYAATTGILVTPILAFALPLLSVVFAIWAPRKRARGDLGAHRGSVLAPQSSTTR